MKKKNSKWPDRLIAGILMLAVAAFFAVPLAIYYLKDVRSITPRDIDGAEKIFGLKFSRQEKKMMLPGLEENRRHYASMREVHLGNEIPPAFYFFPAWTETVTAPARKALDYSRPEKISVPENKEDLAFMSVIELAELIRTGKITSLELTRIYLDRLKKFGPQLECTVTLTEELALNQARRADQEIAAGRYRGPLHGIPWGAKDLLATRGIRTTWGSAIYKNQIPEENATVVDRLEAAGAVLVAKLSMGELAMGDVWFGGRTRNPWNTRQGSSGSSAGSAAAVTAGLTGFAIGTETLGSIVSPSTRCGATGLRPTFGRVSRQGAMALSWTMDKIGPLCRTVEDCALVLEAISGPDGRDPTVKDALFDWDPDSDLKSIRAGFLESAFEKKSRTQKFDLAVLEVLKKLGVQLSPVELPSCPVESISFILDAEAAAAFDEVTRENLDDLMVRQGRGAWPNIFRAARFVPAVEYIQANRVRTMLEREMARTMENIDVFVTPSYGGNVLLVTNLTGHPAVVVPSGFDERGNPVSITFIGRLYGEAEALRLAKAYQDASDHHLKHPKL